jgi:lysophospholipase L1-like esterase
MMRLTFLPALFSMTWLASAGPAPPIRIALVGDSTVNDQGGWGPGFRASFTAGVEVTNFAMNGRSSKSFRDEGRWEPVLASHPAYVLIQFGHNDVPGKGPERETDAATTYRRNLERYIDEARAAGAQPVLVTSIVRRNFDAEGKIRRDSLVPYVAVAREVAAERKVPLIDLYNLTLEQAERLGPDGCAEIDGLDKEGKRDHTHLGAAGQQQIGRMAAREFIKAAPPVRVYAVQP